MLHKLYFEKTQIIRLGANIKDLSVKEAVIEAIKFVQDENLKECELIYNGFLFDIEPDSKLETKASEYNYWLDCYCLNKQGEFTEEEKEQMRKEDMKQDALYEKIADEREKEEDLNENIN